MLGHTLKCARSFVCRLSWASSPISFNKVGVPKIASCDAGGDIDEDRRTRGRTRTWYGGDGGDEDGVVAGDWVFVESVVAVSAGKWEGAVNAMRPNNFLVRFDSALRFIKHQFFLMWLGSIAFVGLLAHLTGYHIDDSQSLYLAVTAIVPTPEIGASYTLYPEVARATWYYATLTGPVAAIVYLSTIDSWDVARANAQAGSWKMVAAVVLAGIGLFYLGLHYCIRGGFGPFGPDTVGTTGRFYYYEPLGVITWVVSLWGLVVSAPEFIIKGFLMIEIKFSSSRFRVFSNNGGR
jgi:hypothetical protein